MTLDYETHKDGIQLSYSDGMYCKLKDIAFYKRVKPTIIPFVGKKYPGVENKVLLVCKSFAAPTLDDFSEQLNEFPDKWHSPELEKEKMNKFIKAINKNGEDVRSWLETKNHLCKKFGWVWWVLADAMLEIKDELFKNPPQDSNEQENWNRVYKHLALMNYFIRPATENARNLKVAEEDKRESYKVFKETVKALEPKFIFIFGTEAGPAFEERMGGDNDDKDFTDRFCKESRSTKPIIYGNPYSPTNPDYWDTPKGKQLFLDTLRNNWGNDKW